MKLDAKSRSSALTLTGLFLLLLAGLSLEASAPAPPSGEPENPEQMVGTVRAVDEAARRLEVITGVGHAVRLVRMQVAQDCQIDVPGALPAITSLKPGAFVRIGYRAAPGALEVSGDRAAATAVTIEAIPIEQPAGVQ